MDGWMDGWMGDFENTEMGELGTAQEFFVDVYV